MNFDLLRLRNGIEHKIEVNETYSFSEEELRGSGVSKLDDVLIEGEIRLNSLKEIYLSLEVSGVMIMPCAITLKPVEYPFDIVIEGDLEEIHEESTENTKKCLNSLDILPIIWENILMEIPMRVVSPDAEGITMSGDGWKFTNEEEVHINSELSKLTDLLQDSEVR